jgi:uncharacterized paraquat-inducible protein A
MVVESVTPYMVVEVNLISIAVANLLVRDLGVIFTV